MKTTILTPLSLFVLAAVPLAERLDCADVELSFEDIPVVEFAALQFAVGDSLIVGPEDDPVLRIGIAPPKLADGSEGPICGVDYVADLTDGIATITFFSEFPYYVEAHLASGITLAGYAVVGLPSLSDDSDGEGPYGGLKEWTPTPDGEGVFHAPDAKAHACDVPAWVPKKKEAKTRKGLVDAICAASEANGGPINIVTVSHGSPASISGAYWMINKSNACDFAMKIKAKIMGKCWSIVACSVAAGDCGMELLCTLADKAMAKVTAAKGCVWVIDGKVYHDCAGLCTKDSRPSTSEEDGRLQVIGEEPVNLSNLARVGVFLPLDAFEGAESPYQKLMMAWGQDSTRWDLDRDDYVDRADLALLIAVLHR